MAGIQYLFGISIDNENKNTFLYIFKRTGDFFIENNCITFENMFNVTDNCTNNQIDIDCLDYTENTIGNEPNNYPRIIFIKKNKNILRKYTIFYTEKENNVNINNNQICFTTNPIQYEANNINNFIKKQLFKKNIIVNDKNIIVNDKNIIDLNSLLGIVTQFIDTLNKNKLNTQLTKEFEESNQDESNQDESNQDESNQDESNQDESNQDESNQDESNQDESNDDWVKNETDESQSSININTLLGIVAEMINTLNKK